MNPLGVLTARDVMGDVVANGTSRVTPETPVIELITQLNGENAALDVVDDAKTIGSVTAQSIVERLKS